MKILATRCCLSRTRTLTICLTLVLSVLAAAGSCAQDVESPPKKPTEALAASPQSIPLAQVAAKAQQAREIVDEMRALTEPDPNLDSIAVRLKILDDSLKSWRSRSDFQNLQRVSQRSVTDLNSRSKGVQTQIDEWEGRLQEKSAELSEAIERLNQLAGTQNDSSGIRSPGGGGRGSILTPA